MKDRDTRPRPGGDVGELERNVAAAHEDDVGRKVLEIEELIAGGQPFGTGKFQGHRRGAGSDEHATTDQAVVADGQRGGAHEPGAAVKLLDPDPGPGLLGPLRRLVDHGMLEPHELRPVEGEPIRRYPLTDEVTRVVDRLRGADKDLLRHATAQRAGSPEGP
jgi:hypothetical protein